MAEIREAEIGQRGSALAQLKSRVKFASIGPVTIAAARDLGLDVAIEASEHTAAGLVRAILDHVRAH